MGYIRERVEGQDLTKMSMTTSTTTNVILLLVIAALLLEGPYPEWARLVGLTLGAFSLLAGIGLLLIWREQRRAAREQETGDHYDGKAWELASKELEERWSRPRDQWDVTMRAPNSGYKRELKLLEGRFRGFLLRLHGPDYFTDKYFTDRD